MVKLLLETSFHVGMLSKVKGYLYLAYTMMLELYVPMKCFEICAKLHGVITYKTTTRTFIVVKVQVYWYMAFTRIVAVPFSVENTWYVYLLRVAR
jgi:hypothetical protein